MHNQSEKEGQNFTGILIQWMKAGSLNIPFKYSNIKKPGQFKAKTKQLKNWEKTGQLINQIHGNREKLYQGQRHIQKGHRRLQSF